MKKFFILFIGLLFSSQAFASFQKLQFECRGELRLSHANSFFYDFDAIVNLGSSQYDFLQKPNLTVLQVRNRRGRLHLDDAILQLVRNAFPVSQWKHSRSRFGLNVFFNPFKKTVQFQHRLSRHGKLHKVFGRCKSKSFSGGPY